MKLLAPLILTVLSLNLFVSCTPDQMIEKVGYKFDPKIKATSVNTIVSDLATLTQLDNLAPIDGMDALFHLSRDYRGSTTPVALTTWLDDRVTYIVNEMSSSELESRIFMQGTFRHNDPLPAVDSTAIVDNFEASRMVTIMSNTGALLYYIGKKEHSVLGLKIANTRVPVSSPRIGIISIGEGLFMPELQVEAGNLNSPGNAMGRITTYLHEGRHSDGNKKALSFLHAKCPYGHSYQGHYACDRNANGPYRIGATFARYASVACKNCSNRAKLALLSKSLDSMSRVIEFKTWNDEPEFAPGFNFNSILQFREVLKTNYVSAPQEQNELE